MRMKFRIMEKKLLFLHYIITQNDESLAHQILYEQKEHKWPGLVQECMQFITELNILDPFDISLSKSEWRRIVKEAITKANSDELKDEIVNKYKKLKKSDLAREEFGRKDYLKNLSLQQARTNFKFRSSMTQHVKMNQKSNKEYADVLWRCEECGMQDTNAHLLWCKGYESLREGKDLGCDKQLCNYLQRIFISRSEKTLD